MKRYYFYALLVLFFVGLSFLSYGVASAQGPTSTPTLNRTPPATPTYGSYDPFPVGGSSALDCPEGTPVGWGVVTPDPLWLAMCAHCLPIATSFPTLEFPTPRPLPVCYTPEGGGELICETPVPVTSTSTPTATATATFTPTVTPTASAPGMSCRSLREADCWQGEVVEYQWSMENSILFGNGTDFVPWDVQISDDYSSFTLYYDFTLNVTWSNAWEQYQPKLSLDLWVYDPGIAWYGHKENVDLGSCGTIGVSGQCVIQYQGSYSDVNWSPGLVVYIVLKNYNIDWPSGDTYVGGSYYLSTVGFPVTPTPSPTPVSTPSNICYVVNSGVSDLTNQTMSFWSASGPPVCLIIPSYSTIELLEMLTWISDILPVPIPGLEAALQAMFAYFRVESPPVTICFQPYEFMPVNLFGVVLLFQTFVDVVFAGFIINHLMSK